MIFEGRKHILKSIYPDIRVWLKLTWYHPLPDPFQIKTSSIHRICLLLFTGLT